MGYGFDLDEWVVEKHLRAWHTHLHQHFGWPHLLGGRDVGPNRGLDHRKRQIYEGLDYSGYEHHRPTYEVYRAALDTRAGKPSFSEDRFRIRQSKTYAGKDYNIKMTRRGLWHSTMAGGVANIWGHLPDGRDSWLGSAPYEQPERTRTYAKFFGHRFQNDMTPVTDITDGVCLKVPAGTHFVFYKEDTDSIEMDLSNMAGQQEAIAVDAKLPVPRTTNRSPRGGETEVGLRRTARIGQSLWESSDERSSRFGRDVSAGFCDRSRRTAVTGNYTTINNGLILVCKEVIKMHRLFSSI